MQAGTQDRRSLRTRAALRASFGALLLERGFEALTLGEVAAQANVGRSTLYEHFRTKQDLLQATLAAPLAILADLVLPDSPRSVAGLLQHFRDNHGVSRVLLGHELRPIVSRTLAVLTAERLAGQDAPLIAAEITARQIADAQLALIECWVLGRPPMELGVAAAALERSSRALAVAHAGFSAG